MDVNANPDSTALAATLLSELGGHSQLLISLSVAIIGGLVALTFQQKLHNAKHPDVRIALSAHPCLAAALAFAAFSILFGFLVFGRLIEFAPMLFSFTFDGKKSFYDQLSACKLQDLPCEPSPSLRILSLLQSMSFFSAVVTASLFLWFNRPPRHQR